MELTGHAGESDPTMTTEKRYIRIVETKTGKVEREFDVTDKSERYIEKAVSGMLQRINTEQFHVEEPTP